MRGNIPTQAEIADFTELFGSDVALTPPTAPDEWVTILLCVLVGWMGGSWGRFILNNREAVYEASQLIKGADRKGVVQAGGRDRLSA